LLIAVAPKGCEKSVLVACHAMQQVDMNFSFANASAQQARKRRDQLDEDHDMITVTFDG